MDYYEENAAEFVAKTRVVDMQEIYSKFLPLLPEGSHILDAGCGSGRDSSYFIKQGFSVTAFDASSSIVALASRFIGMPVRQMRFQEIDFTNQFDGVWACASLLHVSEDELLCVFQRLSNAMKECGILYCSFKYGVGLEKVGDRVFTNMDQNLLKDLVSKVAELEIVEQWVSFDQRPDRKHEQWLNTLIRKISLD